LRRQPIQPASAKRTSRGKGGAGHCGLPFCSLCLCVLCAAGLPFSEAIASGATVQTVDDATIKDATLTFDGQVLTIKVKGQSKPTTMPIQDVARIILRNKPAEEVSGSRPAVTARVRRTPSRVSIKPAPAPTASATTTPTATLDANWRMKWTDGDLLRGSIASWADQHVVIHPDIAPDTEVELGDKNLDSLWHGETADQTKAEAMNVARGDEDTAFVRKEKNGDIVAVRGLAAGIDGDELLFRYQDEDRKINLAKIVGVVFAQHAMQTPGADATDHSFHQVIRFVDGEQISGRWKSLAKNVLVLETEGGKRGRFQLSQLAGIDFRNGRITYLSDLTPSKVEQTPFFDEVIPFKTDEALGGGPLRLGDETYDKGLAVHSRCVLDYDLAGQFDRFRTKMGFEPGTGALGDAIVRVLGDGKPLYENKAAKGTDPPAAIDVDLTGISHLTLEVDFGGGQDVGDRVVWADARAVRAAR
jgi:hypothetical protein